MRLHQAPDPEHKFGYFAISVPFASACHIVAIIVTIIGSCRFLSHQKHMSLGTAIAGGWEIGSVGMLTFLVSKFGVQIFILDLTNST